MLTWQLNTGRRGLTNFPTAALRSGGSPMASCQQPAAAPTNLHVDLHVHFRGRSRMCVSCSIALANTPRTWPLQDPVEGRGQVQVQDRVQLHSPMLPDAGAWLNPQPTTIHMGRGPQRRQQDKRAGGVFAARGHACWHHAHLFCT